MSNTIRMTESIRESSAASTGVRGRRFSGSSTAKSGSSGWMTSGGNTLQRLVESEAEKKLKPVCSMGRGAHSSSQQRRFPTRSRPNSI